MNIFELLTDEQKDKIRSDISIKDTVNILNN